jgi:hypothetical protein
LLEQAKNAGFWLFLVVVSLRTLSEQPMQRLF